MPEGQNGIMTKGIEMHRLQMNAGPTLPSPLALRTTHCLSFSMARYSLL